MRHPASASCPPALAGNSTLVCSLDLPARSTLTGSACEPEPVRLAATLATNLPPFFIQMASDMEELILAGAALCTGALYRHQ